MKLWRTYLERSLVRQPDAQRGQLSPLQREHVSVASTSFNILTNLLYIVPYKGH